MAGAAGQSVTERLKAWWHGYDVDGDDMPAPAPMAAVSPVDDEPPPIKTTEWTHERVDAIQRIFGAGEDAPQAIDRANRLVKPLGLDERMSVLELGCGLGAGLRAVARKSGAWIDGIETNDLLIEQAAKWVGSEGLQKKAVPINSSPFADAVTKTRRDVILSREALHRFAERDDVLKAMRAIMKPKAQLLYTDFMIDRDADQTAIAHWCELHPHQPVLVSLEEAKAQVTSLDLDLRVARDESSEYIETVLAQTQKFALDLKKNPVPHDQQAWVMWEVEYWARTVAAIDSGALRMCRVHAVASSQDNR